MEKTAAMGERLALCRKQAGETLEELAKLINVNKSTVLRWEHGITTRINRPTLEQLAAHYGVDPLWLMGGNVPRTQPDKTPEEVENWLQKHLIPPHTLVRLPIYGAMEAAASGNTAEVIGHEAVEADVLQRGEEYFWLKVAGDSMSPTMNEGDLALVLRQDTVESNSYAAALVDEHEGLIKRLVLGDGWLELHSVNPYYPTRRFEGGEMDRVRIVGRVVESRRRYGY